MTVIYFQHLSSPSLETRQRAVRGLGEIGSVRGVPALLRLQRFEFHTNENVQWLFPLIDEALAKAGKGAVPAMAQEIATRDDAPVVAYAHFLGTIGSEAASAIPALLHYVTELPIDERATRCLKYIGSLQGPCPKGFGKFQCSGDEWFVTYHGYNVSLPPRHLDYAVCVAKSMGGMGPPALPYLAKSLPSGNIGVAFVSAFAAGIIGHGNDTLVALLVGSRASSGRHSQDRSWPTG